MKKTYRILIGVVAVAAVVALIILLSGGTQDFSAKYRDADLSPKGGGVDRQDTYEAYLTAHADAPNAAQAAQVDLSAFEGEAELREDGEGRPAVYTPDGSTVTWHVEVPERGFYNIRLDYLTTESRGVDIERQLKINGETPFSGASQLTLTRMWKDKSGVRTDNQGNQIRPSQVEEFGWQQAYLKDSMGYEVDPYRFYFEQGDNTITLFAENEPFVLREIALTPVMEISDYAGYRAAQPQTASSREAEEWQLTLEGEDAALRSSPSLYRRYDRSSPATVPYSVTHTVLNYIGGDPWNNAGQWIEWQFDVPQDGWYQITVKARQAYQRGAISCRSVYIDGVIPFDALKNVEFRYGTSWNLLTLSDKAGQPYQFYLGKGAHTIRLEATLGEMGPVLQRLEESIYNLNQIYRNILVLTGVNPDRFRDYNLAKVYPNVITDMDLESKRLYKIVDDTVKTTGQKSDRIAVAQTLAVQLENFVNYNERITQQFPNFKDNITSLGTSMQNMSETKLDVDQIIISGAKRSLPAVNDGFLAKAAHEIRSCWASFFVDYNSLGDKYEDDDSALDVWIVTGRDQSTVLKTMIDDTFTPEHHINVNVKLVVAETLLTAVVAGNGPDVVLSVGSWFPVNYAMRNAVEDLSKLPGYDEVIAPFYESALTPAMYNGGVYALPETQEFSVLFYREDVLEELGLKVPNSWDELIALLPTIQGNNMSVGVPYPDITTVDMSILNSMIYQQGGQIYDERGIRTMIDNENGVAAFKQYTSLYNDYGLPTVYDFVSRFRSGEMPIGVASYSTYNTLAVSAPEIRGLWDFNLFPGTLREDGTFDRSVHSAGLCCMMIKPENKYAPEKAAQVKARAWEFMKWWVSAESQVRFGREIEAVLGSSARYTTANRDALRQLAWNSKQRGVLEEQMASTVGFREIAGGYSTTRHMTNAIRRVINEKSDARETLLTYSKTINDEIRIKRQEFGLPLE